MAFWSRWTKRELVLAAGIALGLVVRVATLRDLGMHDVGAYLAWGSNTFSNGLARAYDGIYLPIQYQLFALAVQLGVWFRSPPAPFVKLISLVFECGTLALLMTMVTSSRGRIAVVISYWLNPWFVSLAILGYADFQMAFFVVAFLFLVLRNDGSPALVLLAGCPLAVAVLMKPQALTLIVTLSLFAGASLVRRKPSLLPTLLVIPTFVLFAAYSWYFALHGRSYLFLALRYQGLSSVMPCLTAHMLSFWYPIAITVNPRDWALKDTAILWRSYSFRLIAEGITVGFLSAYAWLCSRDHGAGWRERAPSIVAAVAFCTLLLPMTMTQAHENHLFLGTVMILAALFVEHETSWLPWAAYALLSLAQTINLVGRYRLGDNALASTLPVRVVTGLWAHPSVQWACVGASLAGFVVLFDWLWRAALARARLRRSWAWLATGALLLVFAVVYAVAFSRLAQLRVYGVR